MSIELQIMVMTFLFGFGVYSGWEIHKAYIRNIADKHSTVRVGPHKYTRMVIGRRTYRLVLDSLTGLVLESRIPYLNIE